MNTTSQKSGSTFISLPVPETAANIINGMALLLMPLSITSLPTLHGIVVLVLVVLGLLTMKAGLSRRYMVNRDEGQVLFVIVFMLATAIFVTVLSGFDDQAVNKIAKFSSLILIVPIYFWFRASRPSATMLWYGLLAGALVSLAVGVYEVTYDVYKPGYYGRAKGATHPIIFGDLALLMGMMCVVGIGWFRERAGWQVVLPVLALIAGVVASVLSLSRGGWVAIPFFLIVIIWASRKRMSSRTQVLGVVAVSAILCAAYLIPQTGMQGKIADTYNNINTYLSSDLQDPRRATSIGARFEMWQASWQIFVDHPIVGVGWGQYQHYAQKLVDEGLRNPIAAQWVHPHNQFLSALVSGGVLAGLAIILLFLIPLLVFLRHYRAASNAADVRRYALAGILLITVFAIFNLSESFLERSRTVVFFVFYLAVYLACIRAESDQQ